MRKLKFFMDYNKEEKWLSTMAKKGYELEGTSFRYKFRKTEPNDTVIKIDYREFKKRKDFMDYCTLFEDSGWKHIAGNLHSGTQYFKQINGSSDEDIFSDRNSKAERFKRLSDMWFKAACISLGIFIGLVATNFIELGAIINPKLLYLTPGLWEMQESKFWDAFWFETPFAIFRGMLFLTPMVLNSLYFIFAYIAKKLYRDEKNNACDNV